MNPITRNDIPPKFLFCLDSQEATEAYLRNMNDLKCTDLNVNFTKAVTLDNFVSFIYWSFVFKNTPEKFEYWHNIALQNLQVPNPKNFAPVDKESYLKGLGFEVKNFEKYNWCEKIINHWLFGKIMIYIDLTNNIVSVERHDSLKWNIMSEDLDYSPSNLEKILNLLKS